MSAAARTPELRLGLIMRELDGEFLLFDPVRDCSMQLNASAARLLGACDGQTNVDDLVRLFADEHPAFREQAVRDAKETLERAIAEGFLSLPRTRFEK